MRQVDRERLASCHMSHEDRRQTDIAILRIKRKRTHQPQPLDALGSSSSFSSLNSLE